MCKKQNLNQLIKLFAPQFEESTRKKGSPLALGASLSVTGSAFYYSIIIGGIVICLPCSLAKYSSSFPGLLPLLSCHPPRPSQPPCASHKLNSRVYANFLRFWRQPRRGGGGRPLRLLGWLSGVCRGNYQDSRSPELGVSLLLFLMDCLLVSTVIDLLRRLLAQTTVDRLASGYWETLTKRITDQGKKIL